MLMKKLWRIALGFSLVSASASALPSHQAAGKKKAEASSIRLTTNHGEVSFLGPSLVDFALLADAKDEKTSRSYASLDGHKRKKVGGYDGHDWKKPGDGEKWRGDRPASTSAAQAAPIPEPSALLSFGAGLLVARRAIGRTWR